MILKSLKVERFGGLNPGAFVEAFSPSITVIHGPNGAGKSTLFRALVFGLYQRHGVSGHEALAQIVPRGRDLAPRVEITFEIDGTTWRVARQFVKRPDTELARLERGVFVPESQGSAAEDRLRDLLGSEKNLKGVAGAEYRGIGEVLLVDQGALRMTEVSPLARDRLRIVLDQVVTTQGSHELLAKVEKRYGEVFGKGGDLRTKTALARAEEDLSRFLAEKRELEAEHARAEALAAEIASMEADSEADPAAETTRLNAEAASAYLRHAEAERRREERRRLASDLTAAQDEVFRRETASTAYLAARADHQRAAAAIEVAESRWHELDAAAKRAVAKLGEAESELNKSVHADRDLADRERAASDARRAVEASRRLPDLEDRLARHGAVTARIREVEEAIASRRRPNEAEMVRLREQSQALRTRERDAERLNLRVRVTAESAVPLELGPARLDLQAQESREVVSADAIEVRVPGVVRFEVDVPGGVERSRLAAEIASARAAWREATEPFATDDLARLEDLAHEGSRLEADRRQLVSLQAGLFKDDRRAREAALELATAHATLAEILERNPAWQGTPPDVLTLQATEQALRTERRHFGDAQAAREALVASRRQNSDQAAKDLAAHEERQTALRFDLARAADLMRHNDGGCADDAARAAALTGARGRVEKLQADLRACDDALDALGDSMATIERIENQRRSAERSRRETEERRARLSERLDAIRSRGLWDRLADADRAIEACNEAVIRQRLESDALRLLRDVLVRQQAAAVESAIRPVADRVARMGRFLFGAGAKTSLGEGLVPQSLAVDGCDIPVGLLSAGTQDQVALLVRLALGELYAEKCGRHAFVLDDPLVNCDRDRRGRLLEIFAASRALQFIILTCAPDLYRGLPAERTRFIAIDDAKAALAGGAASGSVGA